MRRSATSAGLAAGLVCMCVAAVWAAHLWTLITVDDPATAAVGDRSCTVLDASDHPHISYADSTNNDLKYAYYDGSQWVIEVADSAGDVAAGAYTSIDLDSTGKVHISYYQSRTPFLDLKYARRDGPATWFTQTVTSAGNVGRYSSLALDSSDLPCIAYSDEMNHYLGYCKRTTGGTWTFSTPDNSGYVGGPCSLALRSNGWPEIAYYYDDGLTKDIEYVRWSGLLWVWRPSIAYGAWPSLCIDSAGTSHIAYQNSTDRSLKYAVWNGTDWTTETVDPAADMYAAPGIGIGSDGVPQIAYCSGSVGNLKLAVRLGPGNWDIETVDSSGQVWRNLSLAVGSANDPQISYYRSDAQALCYAVTRGPLAVRWPR
jgi:hypothetical protein